MMKVNLSEKENQIMTDRDVVARMPFLMIGSLLLTRRRNCDLCYSWSRDNVVSKLPFVCSVPMIDTVHLLPGLCTHYA